MGKGKKLSLKERRFVDAFMGSCAGNATAAYKAAGYTARSDRVAQVCGSQLLSKPKVRLAIEARVAKLEARSIMTAEERDRRLTELANMSAAKFGNLVLGAIKELNKCTGRHSMRIDVRDFDHAGYLAGEPQPERGK